MIPPTKHSLGQLRHVELLARAIEAGAAPAESQVLRLAALSRDQLIAMLAPTGRKRGPRRGPVVP